ncbi:hypothetical protein Dimus_027927 [Dionaea muscipula]
MGSIQNFAFISLAFILISSLTHDASVAQGRQIVRNPIEVVKGMDVLNRDKKEMERSLLGSRPPRCEVRCSNCGHCEAIQVPIGIAPQQKVKPGEGGSHSVHDSTPTAEYSRGDDTTNYKAMSWRCKCGDFIFNP